MTYKIGDCVEWVENGTRYRGRVGFKELFVDDEVLGMSHIYEKLPNGFWTSSLPQKFLIKDRQIVGRVLNGVVIKTDRQYTDSSPDPVSGEP